MLLSYTKHFKPKCRTTKFVRLPKVSPEDAYTYALLTPLQFYDKYLYRLDFKNYATIFYLNNDSIYFHNNKNTNINRIIPMYDYKLGKFSIVSARHRQSGIIWGSWRCVKAPNGNLYAIYAREAKNDITELVVYNLSKGKITHKVEYEYEQLSLLDDAELDKYVHILLNSFVVICNIKRSNFKLHLVDIVNESIDVFTYTPYDYMNNLLEVLSSEDEKEHIRDILSSYSTLTPSWDSLEIGDNVNYAISLLNDDIPFVRNLNITLNIGSCEGHEGIDKAVVISFRHENNELEVSFSTGVNVIIIKKPKKTSSVSTSNYVINPPSNFVLLSKKYKLDSSYDISKSHPYQIHKVSKKFVFSTNIIFENSFIGNLYFPISKRRPGLINIDGITILQTKTGLFANIEKYRRNQGRNIELYAIGNYHVQPQQETLIVLELNKIHAMFHKIKDLERQKYDNFINIA